MSDADAALDDKRIGFKVFQSSLSLLYLLLLLFCLILVSFFN